MKREENNMEISTMENAALSQGQEKGEVFFADAREEVYGLGRILKSNTRNMLGGWTFIETLISIAVILLLTGTVSIMSVKIISQSKVAATQSQIGSLVLALHSYYVDNGRYPTKEQGLASLWQKPELDPLPSNWQGPYLEKNIPTDPWNRPYIYTVPGKNGLPFSIVSYGSDGEEGGEKGAQDISSSEQ